MVEKFGTLDIATASFMPISIVPGVTLIGGNVVLDPAQRTYSFVRIQGSGEPLDDSFVTVHIDTGAVISNPAIGDGFNNPAYDPVTGNVFALHWDAVAMVEKFGTLDVATATFSPIAPLPGVTLIGGDAVLNPVARTYSFRRAQGSGEPSGNSYVTVDIDTGAVISNPLLTDGFNYPRALY